MIAFFTLIILILSTGARLHSRYGARISTLIPGTLPSPKKPEATRDSSCVAGMPAIATVMDHAATIKTSHGESPSPTTNRLSLDTHVGWQPTMTELKLPTATNPGDMVHWQFNATEDARNYGLTASQCAAAFAELFSEIDRAVAHRQKIGSVTPADIDLEWKKEDAVRALVYDRQVQSPRILKTINISACVETY